MLVHGGHLRRAGIKSQSFFEQRRLASYHCPAGRCRINTPSWYNKKVKEESVLTSGNMKQREKTGKSVVESQADETAPKA